MQTLVAANDILITSVQLVNLSIIIRGFFSEGVIPGSQILSMKVMFSSVYQEMYELML